MVFKYVFRVVYVTSYVGTSYVSTHYVLYGTWYILHFACHVDTSFAVRSTPYVDTLVRWYELISTCHVGTCYAVRATWISLYDFPPLSVCQGRLACRKWFCFLDLKIKNDWQFHFRYSNFQGKGNKRQYLRGCIFWGI